ncbi:sterol carrier family protein [Aeromicrobium halocynthiae]
MARAMTALTPEVVQGLLDRLDEGDTSREVLKPLTKHFLSALVDKAPGRSVEVRVPPFAAAQCIEGATHTRGTPPAVVETDAETWIALARGTLSWSDAAPRVHASGERSDLSPHLPLA